MAAYLIARVQVHNWDVYKTYIARTPAVIAQFGGKFLARGGEVVPLEGPAENGRIIVIEFASLDQARRFYASPEYQELVRIRQSAATGSLIIVDGFRPA